MAVILINTFIVPDEQQDEFLRRWKETTEHFRNRPGFLETHLHRNTGVGNGTFKFVNYAKWESADAWRSNHDEYKPREYELPGVKGHPAIYEIIVDVVSAVRGAELAE